MQKKLTLCGLVLLAAFLLALNLLPRQTQMPEPRAASLAAPERVRVVLGPFAQKDEGAEASITMLSVFHHRTGQVLQMDMEDYVFHVLAGEMPASFEPEALKAQAIAARSYAAWKSHLFGGSGCSKAKGADVCTDSTHCMAYLAGGDMAARWGDGLDEYSDTLMRAVEETRGIVCAFGGEPIQALFHSVSGGKTEDVGAVYANALPYLRSVESHGEEEASKFSSTQRMSKTELASRLNKAFPGANLRPETVETQLGILTRSQSGRVQQMNIGKVQASGKALRSALGLNSTNFTLSFDGDTATFFVTGYGHGVGMSQAGANAMAKQGCGHEEILLHYYQGVSLERLQSLA